MNALRFLCALRENLFCFIIRSMLRTFCSDSPAAFSRSNHAGKGA